MIMLASIIFTYYLPFFYQAKGHSAVKSGVDIIPMMMAMVVGTGLSGWLSQLTGRYTPYLILGPIISSIAGGLFFTVDQHTSNAKLVGFQILFGFGLGLAFQMPRKSFPLSRHFRPPPLLIGIFLTFVGIVVVAIQAEYADAPDLIPQASSLLTYLQLLGAVCGIS